MPARHLRKIVPVIPTSVCRNISIGQNDIQRPIVVQISKLRAKTPPTQIHAHRPGQIFKPQGLVSHGHPQIIPLNENTRLRYIGLVNCQISSIQHIAKCGIHTALRLAPHPGLFSHLDKPLSALVHIQLGNPVIIGQKQIGKSRAVQIRRTHRQCPPSARDPDLYSHIFKCPIARVPQQILSPSIIRIFKTLRHHPRGLQIPQIQGLGPVTRHKNIQITIAIVIYPNRTPSIDPPGQTRCFSHALKRLSIQIAKQLGTAPFIQK